MSAQYTISMKISARQVSKTETTNFFAPEVRGAIEYAQKRVQSRQGYFDRVARNCYTVELKSLKLYTPGKIGNPKYDPDADRCDDCGRPFWKGHNYKVEH